MILALGMLGVLLVGGIDISIGSTVAFAGMATALFMRDGLYTATPIGILVAVVIGALWGLLIGVIIAKGKVLPIIATLGFMNIIRGATYIIADSRWVAAYEIPENFKAFATGSYLGFGVLNNLIVVMILCYVFFFVVMKWTKIGRKIYAVGSNPEAAAVSGIKIANINMLVYTVMGAVSGLAGALWVSLYASAQGNMAEGIEMDVIAACVIGGVSLNGGKGSVVGVFLGGIIMSIIGKALPLIHVDQFWQKAVKGLIILIAIIINIVSQRMVTKNNLKRREL